MGKKPRAGTGIVYPNPKRIGVCRHGRGYFINCKEPDTQLKKYTEWKQRPPPQLERAIVGTDRCSMQLISSGQYEIIDGWGRLLPFEALLQQGCEFHPVEAFVCVPPDFIFEISTRVTCASQSVKSVSSAVSGSAVIDRRYKEISISNRRYRRPFGGQCV